MAKVYLKAVMLRDGKWEDCLIEADATPDGVWYEPMKCHMFTLNNVEFKGKEKKFKAGVNKDEEGNEIFMTQEVV